MDIEKGIEKLNEWKNFLKEIVVKTPGSVYIGKKKNQTLLQIMFFLDDLQKRLAEKDDRMYV